MTRRWRTWAVAAGCSVAALFGLVPHLLAQRAPSAPAVSDVQAVRLAVPGRVNSVPSLAAWESFAAVAWAATAGNRTDAFVAVSRDGGRSFAAPVRANDVVGTVRTATESGPRVALGPPLAGRTDPVIVLVWTGREPASTIRRTRSVDGGRTFEPSISLAGAGASGNRGWASLSVDERGEVSVAWLDHRGVTPTPAASHQHSLPLPAATASAGGDHRHDGAAAAPAGRADADAVRAAVARAQQSGFYLAFGGGAPRELAKGACYCCKTALATGAGGLVAAAWRHVYDGNLRDMAFITSRDGGRTFGRPQRVSSDGWAIDGCPEDGPALALDAKGAVHLAWPTVVKSPAEHKAVFYAVSVDGTAVSPRVQVSPRNRSVAHPQIVLTPAGAPMVLWEGTAADRGVWTSRRQPDGRFAAPVRVSGTVDASYPVAAVSGTEVLVAWLQHDGASPAVRVQRLR